MISSEDVRNTGQRSFFLSPVFFDKRDGRDIDYRVMIQLNILSLEKVFKGFLVILSYYLLIYMGVS